MASIRHILWDWNGTLLDDVECCVETINSLLQERELGALTRQDYADRFDFPIRGFYEGLGFDLAREDFAGVATLWMERYRSRIPRMQVQQGARQVLDEVAARGTGQSVLSAMEARLLSSMLERFGLGSHMAHARGLDDHHAHSKVQLGVELIAELGLHPDQVLMVGDTLHDLEVAQEMGCQCLLYAGGHQTRARLAASGAEIIDDLHQVVERC